jgi:alginate O-acetyltransferase complex protein AlgI
VRGISKVVWYRVDPAMGIYRIEPSDSIVYVANVVGGRRTRQTPPIHRVMDLRRRKNQGGRAKRQPACGQQTECDRSANVLRRQIRNRRILFDGVLKHNFNSAEVNVTNVPQVITSLDVLARTHSTFFDSRTTESLSSLKARMLFNSLSFLLFFPITTVIYFLLPHRMRWIHLLACSCVFYAAFIPSYLLVLLAVILIDYTAGLLIERAIGRARVMFLILSLVANIGLLGIFKYFDFLNANVRSIANFIHWNYPVRNLGMLLPIGLSFHTFQSMAYTIEVYRGRQRAERNFGIYSLYVMFYPQLVAGPIERPQHLLHQFRENHDFNADRTFDGLRQMLWGFFKKVVIADRIAAIVDAIYADPAHAGGAYLILATWLFAIQIYCDFAGYSDIAIGAARVLGFDLMTNFNRPFASQSVGEFWRRWHISLSTWFRDYLYIPLGGSRVTPPRWCLNVMIVFLISGMWHGANWTFAAWGALHGVYMIASRLSENGRNRIATAMGLHAFPRLHKAWRIFVTFNLISLAWVFFRSPTLGDAWLLLKHIPAGDFWARPQLPLAAFDHKAFSMSDCYTAIALVIFLFVSEWLQSRDLDASRPGAQPIWLRWTVYYALILLILWIGVLGGKTFIYFQF